jgi:hypothetical protein
MGTLERHAMMLFRHPEEPAKRASRRATARAVAAILRGPLADKFTLAA